jgi:hypothetical protein
MMTWLQPRGTGVDSWQTHEFFLYINTLSRQQPPVQKICRFKWLGVKLTSKQPSTAQG